MHYHSLIEEFIDDQDNTAHIVYESFPFNIMPEYAIKALVYTVKHHAQNELIVVTVANYEDGEIAIHAEDCNIVIDCHDIILKRVCSAST